MVIEDNFTGNHGDELTVYSSNWVEHPSSQFVMQIASNRVRGNVASGLNRPSLYYHTAALPTADYSVQADIYEASSPTDYSAGVMGRCSSSAATFYLAQHVQQVAADAFQLYKVIDGVGTQLAPDYTDGITTGTSAEIKLKMTGTLIEVYRRGESTPIISVEDSSITEAGFAGIRINIAHINPTPTDTSDYQFDNFKITIPGDFAVENLGSVVPYYHIGEYPSQNARYIRPIYRWEALPDDELDELGEDDLERLSDERFKYKWENMTKEEFVAWKKRLFTKRGF